MFVSGEDQCVSRKWHEQVGKGCLSGEKAPKTSKKT